MYQTGNSFNAGDVVRLKSGSPKMTVVKMDDAGDCECIWMVEGQKKQDTFPAVLLEAYEEPGYSVDSFV
jgi:uncharacterized protein YodC (DUF2158 family)